MGPVSFLGKVRRKGYDEGSAEEASALLWVEEDGGLLAVVCE